MMMNAEKSGVCSLNDSSQTAVALRDQIRSGDEQPVVSVFSWAFNHRPFIRESIESILDQRTTFAVEIIVHDDASTDGTAEIIREYSERFPGLFRNVMHTENQYSRGGNLLVPLVRFPRGRYVALTHGDDFWVDVNKLQRQVELFDRVSGVVLTGHRFRLASAESSDVGCVSYFEKPLGGLEDILLRNYVHTATAMFRNGVLTEEMLQNPPDAGDWFIWVQLAKFGKIAFINEVMSAYRIHAGGVASGLPVVKRYRSVMRSIDRLYAVCDHQYSRIRRLSRSEYRLQSASQCLSSSDWRLVGFGLRLCLTAFLASPLFFVKHRLRPGLLRQLFTRVSYSLDCRGRLQRLALHLRRIGSRLKRLIVSRHAG
jgi:glycosyltransferase involved in cell wall biosynthesis